MYGWQSVQDLSFEKKAQLLEKYMTQPYVLKRSQNKPVTGNLFLSLDTNQWDHTDPDHLQPEEYLVNFPKSSTKRFRLLFTFRSLSSFCNL